MKRRVILAILSLASVHTAYTQDDTKSWKHPESITFESLQAWHREGGLAHYEWPRERYVDLNLDGSEEVFLGIEGYSRGMGYALFTHTVAGWQLIAERVEGSDRQFELLPEEHEGWHDFLAALPSLRGRGLFEFAYTSDGHQYVGKSKREVASSELSHE